VCDGQSHPDYADLAELEYTEQVLQEALRLRPPSWGIFRQANLDSRLGGSRIKREDYLLLPQWTLHRDGRFFEAPERFEPSRWADRVPGDTPAYFPFGAGPHACIGRQLALTEAQFVVASLLARFDIETDAGAIDDLRPAGVLQPRGRVTATLQTR
jgi:cytochrome P450